MDLMARAIQIVSMQAYVYVWRQSVVLVACVSFSAHSPIHHFCLGTCEGAVGMAIPGHPQGTIIKLDETALPCFPLSS